MLREARKPGSHFRCDVHPAKLRTAPLATHHHSHTPTRISLSEIAILRNEFLAIVERIDDKHVAACAELPEARGEGHSKMAALVALRDALRQLLDDRRAKAIHAAASTVTFDTLVVE
jgi:hypothetical protein